jgi:hypothetical protein
VQYLKTVRRSGHTDCTLAAETIIPVVTFAGSCGAFGVCRQVMSTSHVTRMVGG